MTLTIATDRFLRQLLWRPVEGSDVPEPMIALLGPRGSGKTAALEAISEACGGSLVHATLDFAKPGDENKAWIADPIAAVAYVAFSLMRTWTNLPHDPTFPRVGLSLLALNTTLSQDPEEARKQIRQLVRGYLNREEDDRVATLLADALEFASKLTGIGAALPDPPLQQVIAYGVAALLRFARRRRRGVGRALRWFDGLINGAGTLDSLIALSQRRSDPLDHLMKALLADLADNARQWSTPVQRCECEPEKRRYQPHEHAWVLLIDHVGADDSAGWQFLNALVKARQDNEVTRDPLLVIAAVNQWTPAWRRWWREPWRTGAERPARQSVPLLSGASFDQWRQHLGASVNAPADPMRAWYPVWLDPPSQAEIAQLTPAPSEGWDNNAEFDTFVRRLSGDLPAAAIDIRRAAEHLSRARSDPRFLLAQTGAEAAWKRALRSLLPDTLGVEALWHSVLPQAVAVGVHLLQPERVADDLDPAIFPRAAEILSLLQENLWVSTFAARPSRLWPVTVDSEEHPAAMHPWLFACLLAGLHAQSPAADRRADGWAWADTFSRLFRSHDCAGGDEEKPAPACCLYYDLACDRFDRVVAALVNRFPSDDHRDWIRLLDQVTGAPYRWPAIEPTELIVQRLVPDDEPGREDVQKVISNLVAWLWLYRDPDIIQNPDRDKLIRRNFQWLKRHSPRSDTSALTEAAARFGP